MIGKIIGAIAGKRMTEDRYGQGGIGGAFLGIGAAAAMRRLGPVALIAAAAGAYAVKQRKDHRAER